MMRGDTVYRKEVSPRNTETEIKDEEEKKKRLRRGYVVIWGPKGVPFLNRKEMFTFNLSN